MKVDDSRRFLGTIKYRSIVGKKYNNKKQLAGTLYFFKTWFNVRLENYPSNSLLSNRDVRNIFKEAADQVMEGGSGYGAMDQVMGGRFGNGVMAQVMRADQVMRGGSGNGVRIG